MPYHLDEHLTQLDLPLPGGFTEFSAELPDADVWTRMAALYDAVGDAIRQAVETDSSVTVVSGDCTLAIGMVAGLQRAGLDPSVVWVDGHGDLQSLETTQSGYLGGMALRLLLGYRPDYIADRLALRPPTADRVLLVDARDLDQAEAEHLTSTGLKRVALATLSRDDLPPGPLVVNLDLDVVDPAELPGLRFPALNGPGIETVLHAAATILSTGRVAVLNIACTWDPSPDSPGEPRRRLITNLLQTRTANPYS
jgi:arginase